jgi:sporulation protein YlmC with PRC-barrel domain
MAIRNTLAVSALCLAFAAPALAQNAPATTPDAAPAPQTAPTPNAVPTPDAVPNAGQTTGRAPFYGEAWTPSHWRASEATGMDVYNRAGENIGEVEEILIDGDGRVAAAVIGVGGFLGVGERRVAVAYSSLEMTRTQDGAARIVVDIPRDVLENAPEFQVPWTNDAG